jgi:uncharacterized membrane protein YgcG
MRYISKYSEFEQTNEGLKTWLSTFLLMANLGLVPLNVKSADAQTKKDFVESQPQDKIDAAKFITFLNKYGFTKSLDQVWTEFTQSDPSVSTSFDDVQKYINQDGKVYRMGQKYKAQDFTGVDMNKFTPENWMTDMGSFIPDSLEPKINNFISDYEQKTSIEIGIITVNNLDGNDIFDYSQDQFERLGVGKKGADNGILIVFSMEDRKSRIHTGRGMEEFLTDAQCRRLLDNVVKPYFKKGEYFDGTMTLLQSIREELGDQAYEEKVEFLKKKKEADEKEFQQRMDNFTDFLFTAFMALIVLGPIAYGIYRLMKYLNDKEKARQIKEQLLKDIDKYLNEAKSIKSSLPKDTGTGSDQLEGYLSKLREQIEGFDLERKITNTDQQYLKIVKDFNSSAVSQIKMYTERKSKLLSKVSDVKNIDSVTNNTYSKIEQAVQAYQAVKDFGYSAPTPSNISELEKASKIASEAKEFLNADKIDQAIRKYDDYISMTTGIIATGSAAIVMLSSIKSAKSRVERANDIVDDAISNMDRYSKWSRQSERDEAMSVVDKILPTISGTDFLGLEKKLDSILGAIDSVTRKWKGRKEDEEEKERRKREEERRRKRQEEEEEERRRRSYYSSSSSSYSSSDSGSSWGGFGGGDSGGGGASSDW